MAEHNVETRTPMRRSAPRLPVDWPGTYQFASVAPEVARRCRVVDVSPQGAGVVLFDLHVDEVIEGLLQVTFVLSGDVRNIVRDDERGTARVGIQFPTLTDEAREFVRSIREFNARW